MTFLHLVVGWPVVIASLLLSSAGIAKRSRGLLLAGAVASIPFMFHMLGTEPFVAVSIPVTMAHFTAPFVARRPLLAALLVAPFVVIVAAMAWWIA